MSPEPTKHEFTSQNTGPYGPGPGEEALSPRPAPRKDAITFYKVAVVVLSVIVVGLLAVMSQNSSQSTAPETTVTVTVPEGPGREQQQQREPSPRDDAEDPEREAFLMDLPRRVEGDPLAKGDVDARIVMTEWADYRCPFCSVFTEDTLPLLQPLIDDGTLRIEFRDLAIFGADSINAAAGARAAGEQGLYWEFATALYESLPNQGHPPVDDDVVTTIANQVGVADMDQFRADYASEGVRGAVESDSAEAQGFGISGTPAFLIGTEFISGAQPVEVFETVIAQEIAEQN